MDDLVLPIPKNRLVLKLKAGPYEAKYYEVGKGSTKNCRAVPDLARDLD